MLETTSGDRPSIAGLDIFDDALSVQAEIAFAVGDGFAAISSPSRQALSRHRHRWNVQSCKSRRRQNATARSLPPANSDARDRESSACSDPGLLGGTLSVFALALRKAGAFERHAQAASSATRRGVPLGRASVPVVLEAPMVVVRPALPPRLSIRRLKTTGRLRRHQLIATPSEAASSG